MTYGVRLRVWGDYACFTRPEMKAERVSYDVLTPSAARGILEAIHWKPAILWTIERIRVLAPIRFESLRRNEVGSKIPAAKIKTAFARSDVGGLGLVAERDRQQRATTLLRNVDYVIEAHFSMTARSGESDNPAKHLDMFQRRARSGQCFHQPCLGCREFPAAFELIERGAPLPAPDQSLLGERDLGYMLLDIDHEAERQSRFFRAHMIDGVIEVPRLRSSETVA